MIVGLRSLVPLVLAASAATAPFQCARRVDPDQVLEEDPGEALWDLAERFKAQGDPRARFEALRFLVAKYPSSRFAEMAKQDLATLPSALPTASASPAPAAK